MWRVGCAVIIALLAGGCCCNNNQVQITTVSSCGTFSFIGADHGNHGIDCDLDFTFDPARCQSTCTCNSICYIQMIRGTHHSDGTFLQPTDEQAERVVSGQGDARYDGWAVDRVMGKTWGYYGRDNNGNFDPELIPSLGSNAAPARLHDSPFLWPTGCTVDVVSVAVCIDPSSGCVDHLLGYQHWQFIVQDDGVVPTPTSEEATDWMRAAFNLAVDEWNRDAAALGKNQFPAMSRMP